MCAIMGCTSPAPLTEVEAKEGRNGMGRGKVKGTNWVCVFPPDKGLLRGEHRIAAFIRSPRLPFTIYQQRKEQFCQGRQDWLSACHQNSVEPLAWQPTDLRSPSIVFLIDYFPCNYSHVTLNISLLQERGKRDLLFEGRHSYCHIGEP